MPTASATESRFNRVRHECKFVVPLRSVDRVGALLDHLCVRDPAFPSNIIKSLYFDSNRLELLRQKQASEFLKRKVRIRWYVDPRSGEALPQAHLEVKTKNGARGGKTRLPLSVPAASFDRDPIAAADELDEEATSHLYGLQPACVIQYQRRRYIEMGQGFRMALDTDIRASSLNRTLLRDLRESRPTCAVLEVKGAGARELPPSLSLLHRWGVQKAAFSKYAACLDGTYPMETDPI